MLKRMGMTQLLLLMCCCTAMPGYGWSGVQEVVMEGRLKWVANKYSTISPDGEEKTAIRESLVLVTDDPVVISGAVMVGTQQLAADEIRSSYMELSLSEEFSPFIGKRVQCRGWLTRNMDVWSDGVILHVDTVVECVENPL